MPGAQIVALGDGLAPLAAVLADSIFAVSGLHLNVTSSLPNNTGHIVLQQSSAGAAATVAENYTLTVDGRGVRVLCDAYTGCAWGVSTLLQSLCVSGVDVQILAVPCMNVTDGPDAPWRALLVDTARTEVTLHQLFEAAVFCAFYKIRFLHLHLTDDHGWSFPSRAFPALGTQNIGFRGPAVRVFNETGLRSLVAFAAARGVLVVPELEGPGHSSAMRRADPFFQGNS